MELHIRPATAADLDFLASHDRHIARQELRYAVERGRILLAEWEGKPALGCATICFGTTPRL